jgi:ADP-ribose pyrophosphatase YjhB (NUDIX family)
MKKEIKTTFKTSQNTDVTFVYNDLDTTEEIKDKKINGVHAYCFYDSKLVLVYDGKKRIWTPAGGGTEIGESVEDTVVREVKEETNMRVISQKIIGYQKIFEPNKITVQTRSICIVEPYGPFICDPDGDITEIKLIDPKDYKQYFDWGEIGDYIMQKALEIKEVL